MGNVRVYLDNCSYNRPYDDQKVIMKDGIECLLKTIGALETEIFISNLLKEPFDYTEWQRDYFANVGMDEFLDKAVQYDREHPWMESKQGEQ